MYWRNRQTGNPTRAERWIRIRQYTPLPGTQETLSERELPSTGTRDAGLTHGGQVPAGLQHHLSVEPPLRMIQQSPLLWGEAHGHILEGHRLLEDHVGSAQERSPPPTSQRWTRMVAPGSHMEPGEKPGSRTLLAPRGSSSVASRHGFTHTLGPLSTRHAGLTGSHSPICYQTGDSRC